MIDTAAGGGRGGGRDGAGGEALNFWSLILFGPCIFTAGGLKSMVLDFVMNSVHVCVCVLQHSLARRARLEVHSINR